MADECLKQASLQVQCITVRTLVWLTWSRAPGSHHPYGVHCFRLLLSTKALLLLAWPQELLYRLVTLHEQQRFACSFPCASTSTSPLAQSSGDFYHCLASDTEIHKLRKCQITWTWSVIIRTFMLHSVNWLVPIWNDFDRQRILFFFLPRLSLTL